MKIGFFVTCLINTVRPSIAHKCLEILQLTGDTIIIPQEQTCCGQPPYNSGYRQQALNIARNNLQLFDECDYIVAPSGSCSAMMKHHYPSLFDGQKDHQQALQHAEKTLELSQFLIDIKGIQLTPKKTLETPITYHDSCAGLREIGIYQQPRQLMQQCNIAIEEMPHNDECCGFGGAFSVKFDNISAQMAANKYRNAQQTNAPILALGDVGCLLSIEGRINRLHRENPENPIIQVKHYSELIHQVCCT